MLLVLLHIRWMSGMGHRTNKAHSTTQRARRSSLSSQLRTGARSEQRHILTAPSGEYAISFVLPQRYVTFMLQSSCCYPTLYRHALLLCLNECQEEGER